MRRVFEGNIDALEEKEEAKDYVMVETHAHTAEVSECGHIPGAVLAKTYAQLGYKGLIITDHVPLFGAKMPKLRRLSYLAGYYRACEAGDAAGITVLPGAEVRFPRVSNDDFLVIGLSEGDFPDIFAVETLAEMKALCQAHGWLIVQAHPFRKGCAAEAQYLDGVEVYNGHPGHDSENPRAYAFAKQHNMIMLSGSDVHKIQNVGRGGICVPNTLNLQKELAAYIANTRTPIRIEV